jgi:hypothetical protein
MDLVSVLTVDVDPRYESFYRILSDPRSGCADGHTEEGVTDVSWEE